MVKRPAKNSTMPSRTKTRGQPYIRRILHQLTENRRKSHSPMTRTYQALGSSRDRFWRGAKRGLLRARASTDSRPSNRWRSMRTNVRNALSYAERWPPPGRTKPQWPRNFKKVMGWIFLATSLHYLRVSIENFPYAIRQQGPVLLIRILLMAPVFSMVVSVISGLAWWTVWKGNPRREDGRLQQAWRASWRSPGNSSFPCNLIGTGN
jgi:hypothetical protein